MSNTNTVHLSLTLMRLMFRTLTPCMPKTMSEVAYNLWVTPPKPIPHPIELEYAKKATTSFMVVDDLKIRVWSWGEGPTVLFMHGWGGRGTQVSSFIKPLNQMGYQVLSFDMPAHGQSMGKRTNGFDMAKTTREILKNIHNLHSVITHSFGGMVFGHCYTPAMILKNIIMFCPPANLQMGFDRFEQTLQLPQAVKVLLENKLYANFGKDVFERLSLINTIKKITQPMIIVHDKQDDVVPFLQGQEVNDAALNSSLYVTDGLGHRKILFDETVIQHVIQFMTQ